MTLQEFIAEEKARLARFEKYWCEQHWIDPKHWPMELESGDWDEQLIFFEDEND